jgi:hypothetical protein
MSIAGRKLIALINLINTHDNCRLMIGVFKGWLEIPARIDSEFGSKMLK